MKKEKIKVKCFKNILVGQSTIPMPVILCQLLIRRRKNKNKRETLNWKNDALCIEIGMDILESVNMISIKQKLTEYTEDKYNDWGNRHRCLLRIGSKIPLTTIQKRGTKGMQYADIIAMNSTALSTAETLANSLHLLQTFNRKCPLPLKTLVDTLQFIPTHKHALLKNAVATASGMLHREISHQFHFDWYKARKRSVNMMDVLVGADLQIESWRSDLLGEVNLVVMDHFEADPELREFYQLSELNSLKKSELRTRFERRLVKNFLQICPKARGKLGPTDADSAKLIQEKIKQLQQEYPDDEFETMKSLLVMYEKCVSMTVLKYKGQMIQVLRTTKFNRKMSSKVKKWHDDLARVILEIVQEMGVGADQWREDDLIVVANGGGDDGLNTTRALTYQYLADEVTARLHLTKPVSRSQIVYCTMQKDPRRVLTHRYYELVPIVFRKARKGFGATPNPDAHWSNAWYQMVIWFMVAYAHSVIINTDAAGLIRCDTLTTHNHYKCMVLKKSKVLAPRSDYMNPRKVGLQFISHFMPGKTDEDQNHCFGVARAQTVHDKSQLKYYEEYMWLRGHPEFNHLWKDEFGKPKQIVVHLRDGGSDCGPKFYEVQFCLLHEHLYEKQFYTCVMSRYAGGSYLNAVERVNGIAKKQMAGHIIFSNRNPFPLTDREHQDNMRFAVGEYQKKLDNAPCMKTVLRAFVSPENGEFVKRRGDIRLLLPGSSKTEATAKLIASDPEFVAWFNNIWDLRKTHMISNQCNKYFFALRACGDSKNCTHPICRNEDEFKKWDSKTWYPGGPKLGEQVWPVADPERPYGNEHCKRCLKVCSGHYMMGKDAINVALTNPELVVSKPPDEKLKCYINQYLDKIGDVVDDEVRQKWASELILHDKLVDWAIKKEKARRLLTEKRKMHRLEKARAKRLSEQNNLPLPEKWKRKRIDELELKPNTSFIH